MQGKVGELVPDSVPPAPCCRPRPPAECPDRTAHCLTPCLHALGSMGSSCSLLPPLSPLQNAQIALLHFCLNPCLPASCRRCSPTAGCPGRQLADAGGGDGGDAVQDQQQVSPPALTKIAELQHILRVGIVNSFHRQHMPRVMVTGGVMCSISVLPVTSQRKSGLHSPWCLTAADTASSICRRHH